ncbi:MAG TPA: ribosome maturation factor [Coprothermobacter proteolyticus]|nr:ribosome maturation factor [Coprothermobacter proteolyticus]HOL52926.1 ribosome maturation factor [Coprothermobacter proteolyticus]HPO83207.1 ribosome maturation factor [Coprothermobacter proteolyticus]
MLSPKDRADLEERISKIVVSKGFYFIDLEERMEKGAHIISVVVHREPSVTIGDCEKLTRAILPLLESFPWYGDNEHLEVTSPGLDRVLKREWEYDIFKGRVIDISFDRDGKSQTIRAKLVGRENENVVIEYEGNYFRIPFDQVRKAKLVFDEGGKEHGKKQKRSHRKGT